MEREDHFTLEKREGKAGSGPKTAGKSSRALVAALLIGAVLIAFAPLFLLKDAEFGGSDDRGNQLIETTDPGYEPWASPVLETLLGGELPGEVESMLFCLQTGIGVGVIAFCMGRFVERKKWMRQCGSSEDSDRCQTGREEG